MKSRLFASVAVCAAVMLGASGCAMISPQGTTIPYSPGDGVNVADAPGAALLVRNALIVANEDGTVGNMIAAVVNLTGDPQTLNVQVGTGSSAINETVPVPAHSVASLGGSADPLRLDGLNVKPGATVSVYFQSGNASGETANVPVLDGSEEYLASYVPAPAATPAQ
ncbi:hypothetical protein GCM10022240_11110 [Microbacterium kribbense]|uniref:DNA modification methylase n=1 Tax=Microbacterium kribbense TaxID=433645 RepID=A0ABP7GBT4_9MICO